MYHPEVTTSHTRNIQKKDFVMTTHIPFSPHHVTQDMTTQKSPELSPSSAPKIADDVVMQSVRGYRLLPLVLI